MITLEHGGTSENAEHQDICFCPLHGLLDTISKKWALMIIAVIGNHGSAGFNELKRQLYNVSSKTLSNTLKDLEEHGLVYRQVVDQTPPVVRYYLTVSGWELRELLIPLLAWVMKNGGHADEGCPIHFNAKNVSYVVLYSGRGYLSATGVCSPLSNILSIFLRGYPSGQRRLRQDLLSRSSRVQIPPLALFLSMFHLFYLSSCQYTHQ